MKEMQATLLANMNAIQQNLTDVSDKLQNQMKEIYRKLGGVQKQIKEIKQETSKLTKNVNKLEIKSEKMQEKMQEIEGEQKILIKDGPD